MALFLNLKIKTRDNFAVINAKLEFIEFSKKISHHLQEIKKRFPAIFIQKKFATQTYLSPYGSSGIGGMTRG